MNEDKKEIVYTNALMRAEELIQSISPQDFEQAIEAKYEAQKKLVELWFEAKKIDTENFLSLLTKMYERLLDSLTKNMIPYDVCIMGYGKLGAGEINFSSDIDIAFIFGHEEDEKGVIKSVREFVNRTTKFKGKRFLWRIDLDLRPGGKTSPIAVSESFFTWYYLNLGRTDDRYALLRARPVAGDKTIGERALSEIEPFIFRRYIDFSALERLKEIKIAISKHLRRKEFDDRKVDIKFSWGGIREIEFIAFVNQLIFGGKDTKFREKRTTKILELIDELMKNTHPTLKECYIFLREVETIIQLDEEQRFVIDEKDIPRLLEFYGTDEKRFFEMLNVVRSKVSEIFKNTFEVYEPKYKVITQDISDDELEAYLQELGYEDVRSAKEMVKDMVSRSTFMKEKDRKIIEVDFESRIPETLISSLVWHAAKSVNKNSSLSYLSSFLRAIGKRKGIYVMLSHNEKLMEILARLMGISKLFANFLINHPENIDTIFLSSQISPYPPDEKEFWLSVKDKPPEEILNEIRRAKKEKILITVFDDLSHNIDFEELSSRITRIYDFILRETVSLTARERLGEKFALPPDELQIPFQIIALGKYGSQEVIYGSDADLLFVFQDEDIEKWIRFSQKLLTLLTAKTQEGEGLTVDMRLRPSGHAGPLALSQKALWDFYTQKSSIWQRITLLKARYVFTGKENKDVLDKEIIRLREESLGKINAQDIVRDMMEIRKKSREKIGKMTRNGKNYLNIKYCEGGMQDIEFIVHAVQVIEKAFSYEFRDALKIASQKLGRDLKRSYTTLRKVEKFIKLKSDVSLEDVYVIYDQKDKIWEEIEEFEGVSFRDFLNALQEARQSFDEILKL